MTKVSRVGFMLKGGGGEGGAGGFLYGGFMVENILCAVGLACDGRRLRELNSQSLTNACFGEVPL